MGKQNPNQPKPKFDWFESQMKGATTDPGKLYQAGIRAKDFGIKSVDEYMANPEIAKPLIEEFGEEEGRKKLEQGIAFSKEALKNFSEVGFDVQQVNSPVFFPTNVGAAKAKSTGGTIMTSTNPQFEERRQMAENLANVSQGYYDNGILKGATRSMRQAAMDNQRIFTKDGKFVNEKDYNGDMTVYAVDEKGNYEFDEKGMPFRRELEDGEEKKSYEEYSSKITDWLGYNRLEGMSTPEALAKGLVKNPLNLAADAMDGMAELFKQMDTGIGMIGDAFTGGNSTGRGEKNGAFYNAMTNFQHLLGNIKVGSTDEAMSSDWYSSPETLVDGTMQVAGQIALMMGTYGGVSKLSELAKLGKGTRAASLASRAMLSSMAAAPFAEEMRTIGMSPRETAVMYTGFFGALLGINQLSELVTGTSPLIINQVLRKTARETIKASPNLISNKIGWKFGKEMAAKVERTLASKELLKAYVGAGLAESAEEMTEQIAEVSMKEAYDKIYQPYFAESGVGDFLQTNDGTEFNYDWSGFASEMAQAGTLGFVGGTMGKYLTNKKGVTTKDMLYLMNEGKMPEFEKMVAKMAQSGTLENPDIDAEGEFVSTSGKPSRNQIAYDAIRSQIDATKTLWNNSALNKAIENTGKEIDKAQYLREAEFDNLIGNRIGEELANSMAEMKRLAQDETPEAQESNAQRMTELGNNIAEIQNGERAYTYLKEAIYNVPNQRTGGERGVLSSGLSFKEFESLNASLKGEKMVDYEYPDVIGTVMEAFAADKDPGSILTNEISKADVPRLEKDLTGLVEDGKIPPDVAAMVLENVNANPLDASRTRASFEKIETSLEEILQDKEAVASLKRMYMKTPAKKGYLESPADVLLNGFDSEYKTSSPLLFQAAEEVKKMQDLIINKSGVYDNSIAAQNILQQAIKRRVQLTSLTNMSSELKNAQEALNVPVEEREFVPDEATKESLIEQLDAVITIASTLQRIADINKTNFNSIYDQINREILVEYSGDLQSIMNFINKELGQEILKGVDAAAIGEESTLADVAAIEDEIHKTLSSLDANSFNELLIKTKKASTSTPWIPGYVKMLRDFSGTHLNDAYFTAYSNREIMEANPESYYTMSREQYLSSRRGASFLAGSNDTTVASNGLKNLNNVFFMRGHAGTGKTLSGAYAVRMDQILRKKGQTLVLANDVSNKKKMENAIAAIGGNVVSEPSNKWKTFPEILSIVEKHQDNINSIVIDEATLMDIEVLDELNEYLNSINNTPDGAIRIILTGDPGQLGYVGPNAEGKTVDKNAGYNYFGENKIGLTLERSKPTKFSFRSGNSEINTLADDLRIMLNNQSEIDIRNRATHSSRVLYDETSGVQIENTEDFDKAFNQKISKLLKEKQTDFVIITEQDKKSKYINRDYNGIKLVSERVLTPEEAQGKEWKNVFVDYDYNKAEGNKVAFKRNISALLSASTRAKEYVLIKKDTENTPGRLLPPLDITSSLDTEGVMVKNNISVDKDIAEKLRTNQMEEFTAMGSKNIGEKKSKSFSTVRVGGTLTTVISEDKNPLSFEEVQEIQETTTDVGIKTDYFQLSTFVTKGESSTEEGELEPLPTEDIMELKRAILYPGVYNSKKELYDSVRLHLLVEKFEPGDSKFYTDLSQVETTTGITLHADLMDATGNVDATISLGGLPSILLKKYSNLKPGHRISLTQERSDELLNHIVSGGLKIEYNQSENALLQNPIPLEDFIRDGSFYNFSNVFSPSQANVERTPYVAYSPVLSSDELNRIIKSPIGNKMMKVDKNGIPSFSQQSLTDSEIKSATKGQRIFFLRLNEINTAQSVEGYIKSLIDKKSEDTLTPSQKTTIREALGVADLKDSEIQTIIGKNGFINNLNKAQTQVYQTVLYKGFPSKGTKKQRSTLNYKYLLQGVYELSEGKGLIFSKVVSDEQQTAAKGLLDLIINAPGFKEGIRHSGKAFTGDEKSGINFRDQPLDEFQINYRPGVEMPRYRLKGSLIEEIITDKESTFDKVERKTKVEPKKTLAVSGEPSVSVKEKIIVVPSPDGEQTASDTPFEFEPIENREFYSLPTLMNTYFKSNPGRFIEFIGKIKKELYESLYQLDLNNVDITTSPDKLNARLGDIKGNLKNLQEVVESKSDVQKEKMLDDERTAGDYFRYVLRKEFEYIIPELFPGVDYNKKDKKFEFSVTNYSEQNEYDDRILQSLLAKQNDLLKLHFFNTKVLRQNEKGMYFADSFLTQDSLASFLNKIQDRNLETDDDWESFFALEKDGSTELRSIYYHMFSPEPYLVKIDPFGEQGKEMHSFTSYARTLPDDDPQKADIIDMITSFKSFLRSGTVSSLISFDASEGRLNAEFTNILSDSFTNTIEDSIKSIASTHSMYREQDQFEKLSKRVTVEDGNVVLTIDGKTDTGAKKPSKTVKITFNEDGTFENYQKGQRRLITGVDGLVSAMNEIFPFIKIGATNVEAIRALIEEKRSLRSTETESDRDTKEPYRQFQRAFKNILEYIATSTGGENNVFKSTDLADFKDVMNDIRVLKQGEGAFQTTNVKGDKVSNISLNFPAMEIRGRIDSLKDSPLFKSNPFVNTKNVGAQFEIGKISIRDGVKNDFGGKSVSEMDFVDQINFDVMTVFMNSIMKEVENKNAVVWDRNIQAFFNPMTFADKTSSLMMRVKGVFFPSENNKLDRKALEDRYVEHTMTYYTQVAKGIIDRYNAFLPKQDLKSDTVEDINKSFSIINQNLNSEKGRLKGAFLYSNLDYIKRGDNYMINPAVLENINNTRTVMRTGKKLYDAQLEAMMPSLKALPQDFQDKTGLSPSDFFDAYYYNSVLISNSVSQLLVGPSEQYKDLNDLTKRASQVLTNRYAPVLRSEDENLSVKERMKLGKYSQTAIVSDFEELKEVFSYMGKNVEVFDGAAFHNEYSLLQMRESYGNAYGFPVSSTFKPISSYLNPETGVSRFDKYASFEITRVMKERGAPFIKKVRELMLNSVAFNKEITIDGTPEGKTLMFKGVPVETFLQLEQAVFEEFKTDNPRKVMEIAVLNNVQDSYLNEVIFTSGVKTGASNVNSFKTMDDLAKDTTESLNYQPRENKHRGVVLNSEKDTEGAKGTLPTQAISAMLQDKSSYPYAVTIIKALSQIAKLQGQKIEGELANNESALRKMLMEASSKRSDVGFVQQLIQTTDFSFNNPAITRMLKSALSSLASKGISFDIGGGAQVVAPATGVFRVSDTEDGKTVLDPNGRELTGFNAFRKDTDGNVTNQSILDTEEWLNLKEIVDSRLNKEGRYTVAMEKEARETLYDLMAAEDWDIQSPEVVISPIWLKQFGIQGEPALEQIDGDFLTNSNIDKFTKRFWKDSQVKERAKQELIEMLKSEGNIDPETMVMNEASKLIEMSLLNPEFVQNAVDAGQVFQEEDLIGTVDTAGSTQELIFDKYKQYENVMKCMGLFK